MKMITVSEKGQIAIPQSIRQQLGIDRGDELVATIIKNKIVLEKAEHIDAYLADDFEDTLAWSMDSLKEVWDNKSDEKIWKKYLKKK
ncbi:MAG: AbrB/MazE/SpoVT family DNA-binding domain-containing protein [Candidatus Woesearchaeota archaeon]